MDRWVERAGHKVLDIFQQSSHAVAVCRVDGEIGPPEMVYINAAFTELTGYSEAEVLGHSPTMLQGPNTENDARAALSEGVRRNRPATATITNYTKDGREYQTLVEIFPLSGYDDNPRYFSSLQRDVTVYRKLKTDLGEKQAMVQIADELTDLGFWSIGAESRSLWWSVGALQLLGLDPVHGQCGLDRFVETFAVDTQHTLRAAIEACLTRGTAFEFYECIRTFSGRERAVIFAGQPNVTADGSIPSIYGTIRDISKIENELIELRLAKQQVDKALETRTQFLAAVSHEVRTPLNAIIGFSEVLTRSRRELVGEKADEYLSYIIDSGRQLERVVDRLLEVTQYEMKNIAIREAAEPLDTLVATALREAGPGRKELAVTVDLGELAGDDFFADHVLVRQALTNLIRNAITHSADSGGAPQISVSARMEEGLTLIVEDHGPGFPDHVLNRLGDAYNKGTDAFEAATAGMGLGLFIVTEIADLHGGRFSAGNAEHGGAMAKLVFPAERLMRRETAGRGVADSCAAADEAQFSLFSDIAQSVAHPPAAPTRENELGMTS